MSCTTQPYSQPQTPLLSTERVPPGFESEAQSHAEVLPSRRDDMEVALAPGSTCLHITIHVPTSGGLDPVDLAHSIRSASPIDVSHPGISSTHEQLVYSPPVDTRDASQWPLMAFGRHTPTPRPQAAHTPAEEADYAALFPAPQRGCYVHPSGRSRSGALQGASSESTIDHREYQCVEATHCAGHTHTWAVPCTQLAPVSSPARRRTSPSPARFHPS